MRKLVAHLIMTLDGVVQFDAVAEAIKKRRGQEVMEDFNARLQEEDAMLLGRRTYEDWAAYWPTSTYQPFADHINGARKYVASRTLQDVSWGSSSNISLLGHDTAESVNALKRTSGKNIGVHGSPTLTASLLQLNLLDELRLELFPVVAGTGARLFHEGYPSQNWRLANVKQTNSGVVILTYQGGNHAK